MKTMKKTRLTQNKYDQYFNCIGMKNETLSSAQAFRPAGLISNPKPKEKGGQPVRLSRFNQQ